MAAASIANIIGKNIAIIIPMMYEGIKRRKVDELDNSLIAMAINVGSQSIITNVNTTTSKYLDGQ